MQDQKNIGRTLFSVGILLLVVSLLADVIGLGRVPDVFGWKQIVGAVAGLGLAGIGIWLVRR